MTKINTLFLLSLALLLTAACENEIPFNLKENPPKLIMNALINADSLNNTLFLNMSGQNQLGDAPDATVEVRVNGQLTETAQLLPKQTDTEYRIGKRFRITTAFRPGDVVRIDATTVDGNHHTWAEVVVPQPIAIEKYDTATAYLGANGFKSKYMRFKITFTDRPKEDNYYRLVTDRQISFYEQLPQGGEKLFSTEWSRDMVTREDVVLTDGRPSTSDNDNGMFEKEENIHGVFDDNRFRDGSYTMTVYVYAQYAPPSSNPDSSFRYEVDVHFRLLSITETEYRYLKALNIIDSDVYDEMTMEPIKFASNVHGGLGIVGINAGTCQTIHVLK